MMTKTYLLLKKWKLFTYSLDTFYIFESGFEHNFMENVMLRISTSELN